MTKLLPAEFTITGNVTFDSQDLLSCDPRTLQNVRRRLIRYVFQEPQQALNPSLTIRSQLSLASVVASMPEPELLQVLQSVGLTHPEEVLKSYPHQLSIGMAQRVMIAMAILPHPSLLIADEPTSALDVSQRYRLLDLLKSLQQQYSMTMILVTHDLELAGMYADYTAVLKKGRIIEHKPTGQLFQNPEHEYSRLLVRATKPLQDPLKV